MVILWLYFLGVIEIVEACQGNIGETSENKSITFYVPFLIYKRTSK
ncbi:hypothetical protein [Vagococcus carniphilus]|nr:hypothetical protein [Vagococcus carniphilus]